MHDPIIGQRQDELIGHYIERFRLLFGDTPVLEDEDVHIAGWLVRQYPLPKAKAFVDLYLTLDNEWLKLQGRPLRLLRRQINAIIVNNQPGHKETPRFVVGFSEDGHPILTTDRDWLKGEKGFYKPVLWEEWLKLPIRKKLNWPGVWRVGEAPIGYGRIEEWLALWKERGWLLEGETIENPYDLGLAG